MTHILVRLMFFCVLLLSAAMILFQIPVSADSDLRALLVPPMDCSTPCFSGIRPGVTTVDEAVQRLQANPIVQAIHIGPYDQYDEQSIDAIVALPLERLPLFLDAKKRIIEGITLSGIFLRLGDVSLLLGQPAQMVLNNRLHMGFITYAAFYPQYTMTVAVDLPTCSVDLSTFWSTQQRVSIEIDSATRYIEQVDYYLTGTHQSSDGWATQIKQLKHASCSSPR